MFGTIKYMSYDIYIVGKDRFRFVADKEPQFEGSLSQVFYVMTKKFGFNFNQISQAILEMNKNGHSRACFGTRKMFMFTMSDEDLAV